MGFSQQENTFGISWICWEPRLGSCSRFPGKTATGIQGKIPIPAQSKQERLGIQGSSQHSCCLWKSSLSLMFFPLSMEFLRLEKSSETNPPIPHPKRFAPNSYGKFLRNCTEPKENPPGKAIPEGKVGIKQELLVLDGLLFLIFSGNFGFRLSALLVLQKKKPG